MCAHAVCKVRAVACSSCFVPPTTCPRGHRPAKPPRQLSERAPKSKIKKKYFFYARKLKWAGLSCRGASLQRALHKRPRVSEARSSGTLARAVPGAGLRRGATSVTRSARNLHGRAHEFSLFRPDYCSRVCFCARRLSEHFIAPLALAEISQTITTLLRCQPRDDGTHVRPLGFRSARKTCSYTMFTFMKQNTLKGRQAPMISNVSKNALANTGTRWIRVKPFKLDATEFQRTRKKKYFCQVQRKGGTWNLYTSELPNGLVVNADIRSYFAVR